MSQRFHTQPSLAPLRCRHYVRPVLTLALALSSCVRYLPVEEDQPAASGASGKAAAKTSGATAENGGAAGASAAKAGPATAVMMATRAAAGTAAAPSSAQPEQGEVSVLLAEKNITCGDAPKPVSIAEGYKQITGVAVDADFIYYSTSAGLRKQAKNLAMPAQDLEQTSASQLTLFGDRLYYISLTSLSSIGIDGKDDKDFEPTPRLAGTPSLVSDATGLYAVSGPPCEATDSRPSMVYIAADGSAQTFKGRCGAAVAIHNGIAYMVKGEDSTQPSGLYVMAGAQEPKLLASDIHPAGYSAAATAKFVYFWSAPGQTGKYLARVPLQGGPVQYVTGPVRLDGSLTPVSDHEIVIEVNQCMVQFDDASDTLAAVANAGNTFQVAVDDDAYYLATHGKLAMVSRH